MKVKIKKLHPDAVIPQKATSGSAAYDLYVPSEWTILKGRQVIPLGFSIELPKGYCAKIKGRSGYDSKGMDGCYIQGEIMAKMDVDVKIGLIDSDYRGGVGVIINSHEEKGFKIEKGQRIAQMTIEKIEEFEFVEIDKLSDTDRGDGGFGSTNV